MIISFNLDPEDAHKLDQLAGWRKRSEWLRNVIAERYENMQAAIRADKAMQKAATNVSRRKAPTQRKKAA